MELKTGRVIQQHAVDRRFLGEGLTDWRGQLIQLTPRRTRRNVIRSLILDNLKAMGAPFLDRDSGVRYDIDSLEPKSTFGYNIAGWGLTHDDHQFIKSDGTSILRFLNPDTMKWQAQIAVVEAGKRNSMAERTRIHQRGSLCQHLATGSDCNHSAQFGPGHGLDRCLATKTSNGPSAQRRRRSRRIRKYCGQWHRLRRGRPSFVCDRQELASAV